MKRRQIKKLARNNSRLSIEAKVIYNMGRPEPVARANFYLIDVDPLTIRADDPVVKNSRGSKDLTDAERIRSDVSFICQSTAVAIVSLILTSSWPSPRE